MKCAKTIADLIGNTPLVELPPEFTGLKGNVLAKIESANPGGSIKDRMVDYVLREEERRGEIKPGDTICDATSGNTGVALAMIAACRGYKAVIVTPTTTSDEKVNLVKSYGAEVIITPGNIAPDDPRSCYSVVERLCAEKGYHSLNQYHNQLNPLAHYYSTGPEIWEQTDGRVTHVVAGIGTGGTISGIGRFLKEKNPNTCIVGVEPLGSWFQSIQAGTAQPTALPHLVEGIGTEKFVDAFQPQYIDRVYQVGDPESFTLARALSGRLGISVGGSTGSIYAGVRRLAEELTEDSVVVFIVPDGGIRYISKMFCEEWMRAHEMPLEEELEVSYEHGK